MENRFELVSESRTVHQVEKLAEGNSHHDSYFKMLAKRFLKHKMAVIGVVIFTLLILMAILAPVIATHHPAEVTADFEAPPSADYWLGTDEVGRDVFSRLVYGAQVSIIVGVGAVLIYVLIGTVLGLVAGYFGGFIDALIMRITDIFMSFPYFMVILVIVSIIGPNVGTITLVIGFLGWPAVCRLVRGSVLSIKEMDFVQASISVGYSTPKILFKQILPNVMSPILVNATFGVANAILLEASLSFLGMGVRPPASSWGNMLSQAQSLTVLSSEPWLWVPPGLMILLAVLSINFIGDGLRDAIEGETNN
ncbi:oligopeptide ABC transporter permease [Isobaculum melis]|uniref:Peptide/nickel transport system permease protein n=1 Tax=Isobaculum melis TaxID=142588 RepID=A0A1H9UGK4_9LACT|nr:oligopeptide ABC transporter permease [Isobaculum melis]SES08314.1 peptide/nickel transport system permease protein [Isobaculum melis]